MLEVALLVIGWPLAVALTFYVRHSVRSFQADLERLDSTISNSNAEEAAS